MSLAFLFVVISGVLFFVRVQVELAALSIIQGIGLGNGCRADHRRTPVDNLLLVLVHRLYFVASFQQKVLLIIQVFEGIVDALVLQQILEHLLLYELVIVEGVLCILGQFLFQILLLNELHDVPHVVLVLNFEEINV